MSIGNGPPGDDGFRPPSSADTPSSPHPPESAPQGAGAPPSAHAFSAPARDADTASAPHSGAPTQGAHASPSEQPAFQAPPQHPPGAFAAPPQPSTPARAAHAPPPSAHAAQSGAPTPAAQPPGGQRSNTMRYVLIGCGAFLLLGLLATAIGGFGLYRAIMENTTEDERAAFREGREFMREASRAASGDRASATARNRFSFEPPGSGRLDRSLVRRYVAVQERVWEEVGEGFDDFHERWRETLAAGDTHDRGAGARFLMERGRLEVRRMEARHAAQLEASMSDSEYAWIEERVLPAWAAIFVERTEGRELDELEEAQATWAAFIGMQARDEDIAAVRPHFEDLRTVPRQLWLLGTFGF